MTSLKNANRRVGSLFAVAALVLATITPGLVPAFASAAQLSERSVAVGNTSAEMEDVEYSVKFTRESAGAVGAVVFDFCSNSPLVGSACTAPVGFDASAATASAGFTVNALTAAANNKIAVSGTFAAQGAETTVPLAGITNPDEAGTLYVRMVTYDNFESAQEYESADLKTGSVDEGGAAISITDTVGVSGAVLESMTFCVAGEALTDNCANAETADAPTLRLGKDNGGVVALDVTELSQGSIYSQISTNAAGGAVVSLKSANDCAGLNRLGVATCDIVPGSTADPAVLGQARIGVTVTPTNGALSADGTLQIAGAFYSDSIFKLQYQSDKSVGVTSPFGDPILNTNGLPANNKNATITFGASVTSQTPAGNYTNDYSLIATGKY